MLVEGRGDTTPAPVVIALSRGDVEMIRECAAQRDAFRGYSRRSDAWGRGMISSPTFTGMLGEHALCVYLNRRAGCSLTLDVELREDGDGGIDLETDGLTIQVKTIKSRTPRLLVRRVDGRKRLRPLGSMLFAFAHLASEYEIRLLGWITAADFRQASTLAKSPVSSADHWNDEIEPKRLQAMSRLVTLIESRRNV